MAEASHIYRWFATSVWVLAGALVGVTAGVYLSATPRQLLFSALVGGCVVLLIRINSRIIPVSKQVTPPALTAPDRLLLEERTEDMHVTTTPAKADPVAELLALENALAGDEARQWLDELLKRQQGHE